MGNGLTVARKRLRAWRRDVAGVLAGQGQALVTVRGSCWTQAVRSVNNAVPYGEARADLWEFHG